MWTLMLLNWSVPFQLQTAGGLKIAAKNCYLMARPQLQIKIKRVDGLRKEARNPFLRAKPRVLTTNKQGRLGGIKGRSRNCRVDAHRQNLIPGIPEDVTLNHVVTKLPWRTVDGMGSVSCAWNYAIHSGDTYKARCLSQSTETNLLLRHVPRQDVHALCIYSLREDICTELPPIPSLPRGIPKDCECTTLDGKLYVLGGESQKFCLVWMMDLAGKWIWRRRADMQSREKFDCGAMHGKIYVFGGIHSTRPNCDSQVFDPKENMWSFIRSMPSLRFNHAVTVSEEEFFVHGGMSFVPWYLDSNQIGNTLWGRYIVKEFSLEIYNPAVNQWRKVPDFENGTDGLVFMAQGKLHCINSQDVCVYDADSNSWQFLHSNDWTTIGSYLCTPHALALNDHLFAVVQMKKGFLSGTKSFVRTDGLGSWTDTIVWETLSYTPYFADRGRSAGNYRMYSIEQ